MDDSIAQLVKSLVDEINKKDLIIGRLEYQMQLIERDKEVKTKPYTMTTEEYLKQEKDNDQYKAFSITCRPVFTTGISKYNTL